MRSVLWQFTPTLIEPVEAIVYEQDTALVLGPSSDILIAPKESTHQLIQQIMMAKTLLPGCVLTKGNFPLFHLFAIIHDFDQEPTWQRCWIAKALHHCLLFCEQYQLKTMALPPLGCCYGELAVQDFLTLLQNELDNIPLFYLRKIWIIRN